MSAGYNGKSVCESLYAASNSGFPVQETGMEPGQGISWHLMPGDIPEKSQAHTGCEWRTLWLRVWYAIRELSGDDAYDRYLAHHAICQPDVAPLARKDFFQYQQQKRWGGIQRCC